MMGTMSARSKPEKALAELVEREMGIVIPPAALRMFIRAHWKEVQGLAHDIHGTPLREDSIRQQIAAQNAAAAPPWA